MPIILTDENFKKEIFKAGKPILVDFWMQGCRPCFVLSPVLEKLAEEFSERIIFAKADLETAPLAAREYGINVVPTIILFDAGKPLSGFIGLKSEEEIRAWLKEVLSKDGEVDSLIQELREYAGKNDFSLNPDEKTARAIVEGLLKREKEFGQRYCPCRRITGDEKEDEKIICPCSYHLKELEKDGRCLCGLFVKDIVK